MGLEGAVVSEGWGKGHPFLSVFSQSLGEVEKSIREGAHTYTLLMLSLTCTFMHIHMQTVQ